MKRTGSQKASGKQTEHSSQSVVEEVILQKLLDITTVLYSTNGGKSRLHENVLSMVERSLFTIALQRNNNVKGAAAAYLGINRNTFQKKMAKLGMDDSKG
jgi:DNA-binding protein Fis